MSSLGVRAGQHSHVEVMSSSWIHHTLILWFLGKLYGKIGLEL